MFARWGSLAVALLLLVPASHAVAKDHDGDDDDRGGPAFCRSGAGHPVYGWEWCRERGWDRVNGRGVQRAQERVYRDDDRIYRNDRDRDDRVYRDRGYGRNTPAYDNGYNDGYQKGLEDGRERHDFDPAREKWYRNADRGYNSRYGSKAQYENAYRDAFRRGYQQGYSDGDRHTDRARSRFPF